jgi:hypothetical protein
MTFREDESLTCSEDGTRDIDCWDDWFRAEVLLGVILSKACSFLASHLNFCEHFSARKVLVRLGCHTEINQDFAACTVTTLFLEIIISEAFRCSKILVFRFYYYF